MEQINDVANKKPMKPLQLCKYKKLSHPQDILHGKAACFL